MPRPARFRYVSSGTLFVFMDLLVVRHAIAEDSSDDDAHRRLTAEGKQKMKQGAKGLRNLVPRIDLLATSPLTRAVETAQILAETYDGPKPVVAPVLAPGQRPDALAAWLETQATHATVAVVGHDPGLSIAVSWLVSAAERPIIELKKGGACLLVFGERIGAGEGLLRWLVTPRLLRDLRD